MTNMSLFVPLVDHNKETEEKAIMIASSKIVSEGPLTDSLLFHLQIGGEWFYLKTHRAIHSFEEKESAYILFSDAKKHPELNWEELSKMFFECVREDPAWEVSMMRPEHFRFFLETLAVPISFEPLLRGY